MNKISGQHTISGGENTVEGRGRTASLNMTKGGGTSLETGFLLDMLGENFTYTA